MEQLTLQITGMSCGHCVGSVRNALASMKGVEVQDVIIGKATVRIDPAAVTREQVVDAVEDQGYEVAGSS
jgi:copper chaperone